MEKGLPSRLFAFTVGLFVMTLGIAVSTKADIGTTPISSIPFSINLTSGIDFALVTFIYNIILIFLQYLILRDKFTLMHLIQLPVTFVFSLFTKITVDIVSFLEPSSYLGSWILMIVSVLLLGIGIAMIINSKISMMPGEGAVLALNQRFSIPFSWMKVAFDTTNIVIAGIICIIGLGELVGVREGTIFAAFTVGFAVKYSNKVIKHLFPDPDNNLD